MTTKKQHEGQGIAFGLVIGACLGVLTGNMPIMICLGMIFGVIFESSRNNDKE